MLGIQYFITLIYNGLFSNIYRDIIYRVLKISGIVERFYFF